MAQELQNVTLGSPGFFGLNTEDSPVALDQNFATVADNAVIDRYGRLGARQGFLLRTADRSELEDAAVSGLYNPITNIVYFEDTNGSKKIFATGNNKIFDVDISSYALTDVTPGALTVTSDDWCMVSFNNGCYFFQQDTAPYYYTNALGSLTANTNAPQGGIAIGAFGRLWVTGVSSNKSLIYWSDLLDGTNWTGGTSGSIDISKVWPDGYDEITGLAAYNDFLVIFGRDSIVVYSGADSPATMQLSDTISGVGCVGWRTIQETGKELLYLSRTGLRSFLRTVQGGALPVSDVSNNIRKELSQLVCGCGNDDITAVFYPREAFYLLTIRKPGSPTTTYCFDVRQPLQDGSFRVTRWPGSPFYSFVYHQGTLYCGNDYGIGVYSGYKDTGAAVQDYRFKFYSVVLTFGAIDRLKFLKQIRAMFISETINQATVYWSFGFGSNYKAQNVDVQTGPVSEFGIAEFNVAEFAIGTAFTAARVKPTGSGSNLTIGVEATINNGALSLQEINVQTLLGRLQ